MNQPIRILGVHGIGNHHPQLTIDAAASKIAADWTQALQSASWEHDVPFDLKVAYYAPHVHTRVFQGGSDDLEHLTTPEYQMLLAWAECLDVLPPDIVTQARWSIPARMIVDRLTADRTNRTSLRTAAAIFVQEVHAYISQNDSTPRLGARARVAEAIRDYQPDIVIAHSLGSVVTYEVLWANPDLTVDLLLTLGSPLAMPGVIFERLEPAPSGGMGRKPPNVSSWGNIADPGDFVAVPRPFTTWFNPDFNHDQTHIHSSNFHGAARYLQAPPTIEAIVAYANDHATSSADPSSS